MDLDKNKQYVFKELASENPDIEEIEIRRRLKKEGWVSKAMWDKKERKNIRKWVWAGLKENTAETNKYDVAVAMAEGRYPVEDIKSILGDFS